MVSHFVNEPDHWRARAVEARTLASRMNDSQSRESLRAMSALLKGPKTEPRGAIKLDDTLEA